MHAAYLGIRRVRQMNVVVQIVKPDALLVRHRQFEGVGADRGQPVDECSAPGMVEHNR